MIVNRKSSHHFHVSIYENNVIEYQSERDSNYVLNSMHAHVCPCVHCTESLYISKEKEKKEKSPSSGCMTVWQKRQTTRIRNAFQAFDDSNKGQKLPINTECALHTH